MNAFKGIGIALAIGGLVWLLTVLALWQALGPRQPYATPPPRTQIEQKQVDQATRGIGRHAIIDGEREIVIVMESGKKRVIERRGP